MSLNYSDSAINVLPRFFRAENIVLVEGGDDVPFWTCVFKTMTAKAVKVRPVGCKSELEKYRERIEAGRINTILAMDKDYSFAVEGTTTHPRIIETYGYSIENTLISPTVLSKVTSTLAQSDATGSESVESFELWLDTLCEDLRELVLLDIENFRQLGSEIVLGLNCARFMDDQVKGEVCRRKVVNHIEKLSVQMSDDAKGEIETLILNRGLDIKDVLRGHVLISAVSIQIHNLVKDLRRSVSISNDALFTSLILAFETVFNERHPEYSFYAEAVFGTGIDD